MVSLGAEIGRLETREEQERILGDGQRNIVSLISTLDDSVARVISIIKGALNNQIATIIEFPEKIAQAIKVIENNSRSQAFISNLGAYAKISKVEIFKEGTMVVMGHSISKSGRICNSFLQILLLLVY